MQLEYQERKQVDDTRNRADKERILLLAISETEALKQQRDELIAENKQLKQQQLLKA